ncbi:MAG: ChrR family anti-sigma-E factor, partial [Pseudomonadota bacterium]
EARFLTDYAAGSLPPAQALCVVTHLHYCQACRQKTAELTELGAELFSRQQPAPISEAEFGRLLQRIEDPRTALKSPVSTAQSAPAESLQPVAEAAEKSRNTALLPRALQRLANGNLGQLAWQPLGRHLRVSRLQVGDPQRETSLLFIKAGGSVPHHRHQGDEITVVLQGSFSDHEGKYAVGDFVVRTQGERHRPVASQDEDCLCLATVDAPLVMSNWLLRLAMYFMNRRQAL